MTRLAPLGFTLWQRINFSEEEKSRIRRGRGFDVLLEHNVVTGRDDGLPRRAARPRPADPGPRAA